MDGVNSLRRATLGGEKKTLRNIDPLTGDNLRIPQNLHNTFKNSGVTKSEMNNVINIRKMRNWKTTSQKSIRINDTLPSKTIKTTGVDIDNKNKNKKG